MIFYNQENLIYIKVTIITSLMVSLAQKVKCFQRAMHIKKIKLSYVRLALISIQDWAQFTMQEPPCLNKIYYVHLFGL